jgi:hypothetical protein
MSIDVQNRWYDKYPDLRKFIDRLQHLHKMHRDEIVSGIRDLIMEYDEDLLDKHALEFSLEHNRRRWYDRDPYSWLVMNSLKFVNEEAITDIIIFLNEKLKTMNKSYFTSQPFRR